MKRIEKLTFLFLEIVSFVCGEADDGLEGKASMRALPCLTPFDIHKYSLRPVRHASASHIHLPPPSCRPLQPKFPVGNFGIVEEDTLTVRIAERSFVACDNFFLVI